MKIMDALEIDYKYNFIKYISLKYKIKMMAVNIFTETLLTKNNFFFLLKTNIFCNNQNIFRFIFHYIHTNIITEQLKPHITKIIMNYMRTYVLKMYVIKIFNLFQFFFSIKNHNIRILEIQQKRNECVHRIINQKNILYNNDLTKYRSFD